MSSIRILSAFLLLSLAAPAFAVAAAKEASTARAAVAPTGSLRSILRSGRHADLRWPVISDVRPSLERLYARSGFRAVWLEAGTPTPAATQLIARLASADTLGLDPTDYDAAWLLGIADGLSSSSGPNEQARFDLALSVAAARFVDALEHGRVPAAAAGAQFPAPRRVEPLDAIVESLRNAGQQDEVLAAHQPRLYHYQYLKNALVRYRKLAKDSTITARLWIPRDLKPGMKLVDAPRLRRRLQAFGDMGSFKAPKPKADTLYSPELVEAVKKFQKRHGLDTDGVIWPNTAVELKRPIGQNIRKIELALERWRWLPQPFTAPPIVVNIPAFRLYAYRDLEDRGVNTLAMDVLVGAADRNATPLFSASMTYLVFRPYWEVPSQLMMDELGPRAAWDRELLQRQGIVLVKKGGGANLPLTPENLKRIGRDLRMRQLPGEHNVLGMVKFMFPNMHDVYLHDTQVGGLFALARRDFSHGCIRVSDPVALAEYVLRDQPEWNVNRIKDAMKGEDNFRVNLPKPVPVFVTYATAGAYENGVVEFYGDIYGRDIALDELLRKGYPYPRGAGASKKST